MPLIKRAAAAWAVAGGVLLLAIVAITALNAAAFGLDKVARAWGGSVSGLPGYEDVVGLLIAAAAPMFLAHCQAERGHLAVELFAKGLGEAVNRAIDRVVPALVAFAAVFLAYWMTLGMLETRADGALSRVIGWPVWPFYLPGIASLVLWAGVAGAQAWCGPERAAPRDATPDTAASDRPDA